MVKQKKPSRPHRPLSASSVRRVLVLAVGAAIAGLQASSCSFAPTLPPGGQNAPSAPEPRPVPAKRPVPPPAAPAATAPVGQQVQTRFAECPQFFAPGGMPVVPAQPQLRELCYDAFAILHSGNTRTPVLVAERLNRQMLQQGQGLKRSDKFFADARLPQAERAQLQDYKGSGYSRGHMAPAGDMPTAAAMAQSFSLANMVPQDQKHNAGAWAKIEADTRAYALRAAGDVYVITGPVFDRQVQHIGPNRVAVPSHLFKLVYDPATGKAWAHWQQNAPDTRAGPPISYDELARRTGMRLLPTKR